MPAQAYIYPITTIDPDYHPELGERVSSLASLTKLGLPTPPVVVITPFALLAFLNENNLYTKISASLREMDGSDPFSLASHAKHIQKLIKTNPFPDEVTKAIQQAYHQFLKAGWVTLNFSFGPSHTPEVPQHTVPIKGDVAIFEDIRTMIGNLVTPANLHQHLTRPHESFLSKPPALVVRQFFPADLSGTIYTSSSDQKTVLRVEALWGQQPTASEAALIPDTYLVSRTTKTLLHQEVVAQHRQYTIDRFGKRAEKTVPQKNQGSPKLSGTDIEKLTQIGERVHHHAVSPQKISWVISKEALYIIKTTAFTEPLPTERKSSGVNEATNLKHIAKGTGAGPGLVSGPAKVIHTAKDITKVRSGEIIIIPFVSIELLPAFKKVAGVVAETGGPTSHAAIAAREVGIPAIVNAANATKLVKTGQVITVNGSTGDIYLGGISRINQNLPLIDSPNQATVHPENMTSTKSNLNRTATKVLVNITNVSKAIELGHSAIDGIGRIRGELILADYGIHPQKIIADNQRDTYQKHLERILIKLSQAFGDRPVYYQLSDLPSNQLALLKGGDRYEPKEENPLLGLHGTSRLVTHTNWAEIELYAVKTVRNQHGHKNLHLLIPFVRAKKELLELKRVISAAGLSRGGFEIHVLLQTPANLAAVDAFAEAGIDGICLDLYSVAYHMQGIDPQNREVAGKLDMHEPGLWQLIRLALQSAHSHQLNSVAHTDGMNKFDDLLTRLIELGIGAISAEPHELLYTRSTIAKAEAKLVS